MIYMRVMALPLSRANLDLHESKNSHKKCSKASLQVIKSAGPQRLEVEEGRSKLCRERRNVRHQKELWSSQTWSQSQSQGRGQGSATAPSTETNFHLRPGERRANSDSGNSDNYGGTHLTNDRKWTKIRSQSFTFNLNSTISHRKKLSAQSVLAPWTLHPVMGFERNQGALRKSLKRRLGNKTTRRRRFRI